MEPNGGIKQLGKAMSVAESGVPIPSAGLLRSRPASFVNQVAALAVGEVVSRVRRMPSTGTLADCLGRLAETKEQMRNSMKSALRDAERTSGGTYTVEIAECLTARPNLYVVAFVTRVT